jgi:hypothetical protein
VSLTASIAERRSAFTGEAAERACSVIGENDKHGLDVCSSGQRRFRALLALLLCNNGSDADTHSLSQWELDWSAVSGITYSPERHALIVLCAAPHVLAEATLVHPDPARRRGLPGLRPLNAHPNGLWFRFRHVPTRTLLRIESTGTPGVVTPQVPISWEIATRSWELHNSEEQGLRSVPPMHVDAEQLLAALLVRMGTNDPNGRWRVGGLTGAASRRGAASPWKSLWGRGRQWSMGCRDLEAVTGLTAALTEPEIGLRGTVVLESTSTSTLVGHREATLRLIGPTPAR